MMGREEQYCGGGGANRSRSGPALGKRRGRVGQLCLPFTDSGQWARVVFLCTPQTAFLRRSFVNDAIGERLID